MDSLIQSKCFKCQQGFNFPIFQNKSLDCSKCGLITHKVRLLYLILVLLFTIYK